MNLNLNLSFCVCCFQGSKSFRTHAGRVVTVINDAIVALDSPDATKQLEEMWGKIGESHFKRKISKESFDVTIHAITHVRRYE